MGIVKISSCSIVLGLTLPYFLTNNQNDKNQEYKFQINRTPISLIDPFKNLKKIQDQIIYSIIGALSGAIIGRFI